MMMYSVAKTTSINLRISPEFRADIERLAAYHGLTMSSLAHSLLVKSVRQEIDKLAGELPNASQSELRVNDKVLAAKPSKVVARITPAEPSRQDVQRMIEQPEIDEIKRRIKPRGKTIKVPVRGKVS